MTLTTDTVALELPPSKSHAHRECEWVPPMEGVSGHLVIRTRRTRGGREQADVYAVGELSPTVPGTREFLLTRTTGATLAYVVAVGVRGVCTCRAGECRVEERHGEPCKHVSSLAALMADGAI